MFMQSCSGNKYTSPTFEWTFFHFSHTRIIAIINASAAVLIREFASTA